MRHRVVGAAGREQQFRGAQPQFAAGGFAGDFTFHPRQLRERLRRAAGDHGQAVARFLQRRIHRQRALEPAPRFRQTAQLHRDKSPSVQGARILGIKFQRRVVVRFGLGKTPGFGIGKPEVELHLGLVGQELRQRGKVRDRGRQVIAPEGVRAKAIAGDPVFLRHGHRVFKERSRIPPEGELVRGKSQACHRARAGKHEAPTGPEGKTRRDFAGRPHDRDEKPDLGR